MDSFLSADLPIWDVVAEGGADRAPFAASLTFDEAFARRDELAARDPETRYHVDRSQREVR